MAKRSAPPSASDGTAPKKAARGGGSGGAGRRIQQDMSPNSGAANSNSAGGGGAAAEGGGEQQQGRRSRSASPNPNAAAAAGSNAAATPGANSAGAASAAAPSTKDTAEANSSTSPGNAAASATTTSRPPSRLSTRSSPDDKNSGGGKPPREVQVKELLAHRRLLLERIRQCRSAASLRLREGPSRSVESTSNSNSSNSISSVSGGNNAAEPQKQPANEIEAFKLLTQQAVAATRRERQSSVAAAGGAGIGGAGGTTAPAERGLRRGGSVGKCMAAAVSTLQNAGSIGGWVSDSSTGTGASGSTSAATAGGSSKGKSGSKSAAAAAAGGGPGGGSASSGGGAAAGTASTGKQLSATTATAVSMEGGAKKGKKRPKASESPPPPGATVSEAGATASTSTATTKTKKSKSSSSGGGGGGGGDRDKKKKGGSGQSGASGSSASQHQQSAAAAMRQHHQNALAALGQSDPETLALISRPRGQEARILKQYASNPRVVHPQGRSLRARRDALRDRLEKLVTERKDREARWLGQGLQRNGGDIGATAPAPPAGESPTSVAEKMAGSNALKELAKSRPQFKAYALAQSSISAAASAGSQPLSRASTPPPGGPGKRSPVPPSQPYRPEPRNPSSSSRPTPRRKTHWDYVLEEMKWTATDFESERRWKGAVGRTLGASVLAFHASNGGGKGSPLKSAKSAGSAANGPGGSTKKKKRKIEGSEDDPATVAEAEEEDLEPTVEDLDRARIISKGLSVLIAGHWELAAGESASSASGSGRDVASSDGTKLAGLSDDTANVSVIHRRYTDVVKGVPGMGNSKAAKRIRAPTSDDKEEGDRSSSNNPSHETVTARLEAAIKRANLVGTQPSKKKRPVESADCTVDLQPSQVDAIHFVEAVWEVGSDDDAPTLGVALSGKVASGKTVAMAAAIWRHGDEGPQILFCHAARLVRILPVFYFPHAVDLNISAPLCH